MDTPLNRYLPNAMHTLLLNRSAAYFGGSIGSDYVSALYQPVPETATTAAVREALIPGRGDPTAENHASAVLRSLVADGDLGMLSQSFAASAGYDLDDIRQHLADYHKPRYSIVSGPAINNPATILDTPAERRSTTRGFLVHTATIHVEPGGVSIVNGADEQNSVTNIAGDEYTLKTPAAAVRIRVNNTANTYDTKIQWATGPAVSLIELAEQVLMKQRGNAANLASYRGILSRTTRNDLLQLALGVSHLPTNRLTALIILLVNATLAIAQERNPQELEEVA